VVLQAACVTWAIYQAARELDEDTLARKRRVLGEDHPSTLTTASNLANDLAHSATPRRPQEVSR
jgi:hypothetical protein